MKRLAKLVSVMSVTAAFLMACGGAVPGMTSGGGSGSVDPETCGNYAASDAGAKLKSFLQATVMLEKSVKETNVMLQTACSDMAAELGVSTDGDVRTVCNGVANAIRENLKLGLKAEAKLAVDYKPAVCTVKAEVAAEAAAKCEANASAQVQVTCEGRCGGTCNGTCEGTCKGSAGSGGSNGQCNGECEGTCRGECSAACEGSADVQASAECEARAEVEANVQAECTEPEVNVSYEASMAVDGSKVDKVVAALKKGLPKILVVTAKVGGPVKSAFVTWSKSAKDLVDSSGKLAASLGMQASCVAGQLSAAAGMIGSIQMSITVQVEVSASVSGSAAGGV